MIITTYQQLRNLEQPVTIYDSEGKVEDLHYLDSVIPQQVVVHYEHGDAVQKPIDTSIICYYTDVEVYQSEILWFLERSLQSV